MNIYSIDDSPHNMLIYLYIFLYTGNLATDSKTEITCYLGTPKISLLVGHNCAKFYISAVHAEFSNVQRVV